MLVVALVLWLHQALLARLVRVRVDARPLPVAVAPMQVRSLALPRPQAPPTRAPLKAAPVAGVATARIARSEAIAASPLRDAGAAQGTARPVVDATPVIESTTVEVPVYATRLPPPGRWRYRMQRGGVVGDAELHWARGDDASYELQFEGRIDGATRLEWASRGGVDAAGLAPMRFALRQRGRDRQAVNFQREAGKITFSGPSHEVPLHPGAQDRLSWMVQLPAVVDFAPERFDSGSRIELFVVGARGDADVWTFVVQGREPVDDRTALKLVREPRQRYDTRAEVWLDPADHHLLLRAVLSQAGGQSVLELQRERAAP